MRRECVQETEEVLAIRDEYRLQEWSQIIQAGQNSGLSKREFCGQNGISERQYYYWLKNCGKRLRKQHHRAWCILKCLSPKARVYFGSRLDRQI